MIKLKFLPLVIVTACGPSVKVGYHYDRGVKTLNKDTTPEQGDQRFKEAVNLI